MKLIQNPAFYILIQRTDLISKNWFVSLLSKLVSKILHKDQFLLNILFNSFIRKKKIIDEYKDTIRQEFKTLKHLLPTNCSNLLDIGCGLAYIDIFISNYYNNECKIFLMDKSQIDNNIYFNFHQEASFYNSLEIAKGNLIRNNIADSSIFLIDINYNKQMHFCNKFDLIVSFLAWGFHFPVDYYIKEVFDSMNTNAVLILDIRNNTDGIAILKNYFKEIIIISVHDKYKRVKCVKK